MGLYCLYCPTFFRLTKTQCNNGVFSSFASQNGNSATCFLYFPLGNCRVTSKSNAARLFPLNVIQFDPLPETNIAPEKTPSHQEISSPNHLSVDILVLGSVTHQNEPNIHVCQTLVGHLPLKTPPGLVWLDRLRCDFHCSLVNSKTIGGSANVSSYICYKIGFFCVQLQVEFEELESSCSCK